MSDQGSPVRKALDEALAGVEGAIAQSKAGLDDAVKRIEASRAPLADELASASDDEQREELQQQLDELDEAWRAATEELAEMDDTTHPGDS